MTRPRGDPVPWPPLGLGYWENLLRAWQSILERWAIEMGEHIEPVRTDDTAVSTPPELIVGSALAPGDHPAEISTEIPHERQPIGLQATRHIRRTLTRTTRRDLGRAMVDMCEPGGWQASTLNPDLPDVRKFAILSDRFDKIAQTDDPHVLYGALLALAASSAGWAQGVARRQWRDAKRVQRAAARSRRANRRRLSRPAEDADG